MMQIDLNHGVVRTIPLLSFNYRKPCPKCGAVEGDTRLRRFLARLVGMPVTDFRIAYCQGGKMPIEELPIVGPFHGQQTAQVRYPCAGQEGEHLHRICLRCGYHALMEV